MVHDVLDVPLDKERLVETRKNIKVTITNQFVMQIPHISICFILQMSFSRGPLAQFTFVNCGQFKMFFTAPWLKNLVEYSYSLSKYSVKISGEKKMGVFFLFHFL